MSTRIVLVPGFWLGAWAWDELAPLLRERGFEVDALTLPGLDAAGPAAVGLAEQAAAIVAAAGAGPDGACWWCTRGRHSPARWRSISVPSWSAGWCWWIPRRRSMASRCIPISSVT